MLHFYIKCDIMILLRCLIFDLLCFVEAKLLAVNKKVKLKKVDMHCHSDGASICSRLGIDEMVRRYKLGGITSFVLTNHISERQVRALRKTPQELMQKFIDEYRLARIVGRKYGVRVALGAEVAVKSNSHQALWADYSEFLLYGLTADFLMHNPYIYTLTQEQLYALCNQNNILMYQAHPFRTEHGQQPQDPCFMDGVEINCHPSYQDKLEATMEFADKYNLRAVCGSDAHSANQIGYGGIFVDEDVFGTQAIANYLREVRYPKIFISPKQNMNL